MKIIKEHVKPVALILGDSEKANESELERLGERLERALASYRSLDVKYIGTGILRIYYDLKSVLDIRLSRTSLEDPVFVLEDYMGTSQVVDYNRVISTVLQMLQDIHFLIGD